MDSLQFEGRNDLVYATSRCSLDSELDDAVEWLTTQLENHAYELDDARSRWGRRPFWSKERRELRRRNRNYRWLAEHAAVTGFELARRHSIACSLSTRPGLDAGRE
jgi:hypothetical protein